MSAQSILRTQNMSLISILNFLGMSRHQLENWPHFQNGNFSFSCQSPVCMVNLFSLLSALCLFSWFFNCRELFRTLHIFSKDIPSIPKAHYHRLAAGKLRWNERSHALFKNEWNEKPDVAPHHPNHWSIVARLSNKHGLNHGPQNRLIYEESSLP